MIPPDRLQSKADRYYFKESVRLKPNQFYVSPFDLNVEQGKIEHPYRPTVRFTATVFGRDGTPGGIIVLNYYGQPSWMPWMPFSGNALASLCF